MNRYFTIAALVATATLFSPHLVMANPACDAMFAKVSQDIRTSNIPRSGEDGHYSDQSSLMKIARSSLSQCRWGNDEDANALLASIYGAIPHKGAALTIARAQ